MKIYVSHPIRGLKGDFATVDDMERNNQRAIAFGKRIRGWFPEIDWYVPAEHDEFITIAFLDGLLSASDILDIDCKIIDSCDGILYYNFEGQLSGGMLVEEKHAQWTNKPNAIVTKDLSDHFLTSTIECLMEDIEHDYKRQAHSTQM